MSGRSRGRRSSRAKSRGKGRARARVRAPAEDAWHDGKPPQSPQPEEDSAAAQVQAGAASGGAEPAEPREEAACRLPLDCGLALRARAVGERGLAAPDPDLERATSLAERLTSDTSFVGTVGALAKLRRGSRIGNRRVPARKAPDARSAAGRGPQATVSGKPKMGSAGPCAAAPECHHCTREAHM